MPSQSLGVFHQQAVSVVVSANPFRRASESSSSGRGSAKPCLGLGAGLVSAKVLGLRSVWCSSSLEGGIFRDCTAGSNLRAKRPSMGGGLVPLPAAGMPVQSKLTDGDGIMIVDHGSRRAQSNAMLHEFVKMYKEKTGRSIVEAAHMELADPTISDAFDRCVEQGATRVIISPYFLFPGRHWDKRSALLKGAKLMAMESEWEKFRLEIVTQDFQTGQCLYVYASFYCSDLNGTVNNEDIPSIAAEAAKKHPSVSYLVTAPIGLHELMVTVINDRMEYCLSQVAGEVSECDMCHGSGRCKQSVS